MKIAVFVDHFPSSTQTFVLHQIAGIAASGHDLTILTRRVGKPFETLPPLITEYRLMQRLVHLPKAKNSTHGKLTTFIRCLQSMPNFMILLKAAYFKFIKNELGNSNFSELLTSALFLRNTQHHFDIIHCQFGMLGAYMERLRRTGAITGKIVTSFRGYDTVKHLQISPDDYRDLFKTGDGFLPVCQYFRNWLINNHCPESRITVMQSGIDVKAIAFEAATFPLPEAPIHLIAIGRLVEKKGFEYLLDAAKLLTETIPNFHLSIVGDGPSKGKLEKKIGQHKLENTVSIEGLLSHADLLGRLKSSHAIIVPSITATDGDQEGIPNVAKEAMALGIPVIATRHSGTPELIEHNQSGLLVPEKDAHAIASALTELFEDSSRFSLLTRNARQKVEAEYDIKILNQKLLAYYDYLLIQ